MSSIRISGILFGLGVMLFALWRFRGGRFTKTDLAISVLLSGGSILLSLYPGIFNEISYLLAGRYGLKSGRLLSVVIASNFVLFVLVLRLMAKQSTSDRQLTRLVSALAMDRFRAQEERPSFSKCILVVIPAFNEAENLPLILGRIPSEIQGKSIRVLVVVDGATDKTAEVARAAGFPVIIHPINRGGGAALRVGYAVAVQDSAEIVVTMDADGQHQPEEIQRLVEPILRDEADFVCGSRVLGQHYGMDPLRRIGIVIFNTLISILMRRRITDCSNAFRAIKTECLSRLRLEQDQFHTTEILIEAIKKGFRVKEVPVTVTGRISGSSKKPPGLLYGWGFLKAIFKSWWRD